MFIKQLAQDLVRHPMSMVIIGGATIYIVEAVKERREYSKHQKAIANGTAYSGYKYDGLFVRFEFDAVKGKETK